MALNSLLCADVPLRTYTLTLGCVGKERHWKWRRRRRSRGEESCVDNGSNVSGSSWFFRWWWWWWRWWGQGKIFTRNTAYINDCVPTRNL